MCPQSCSLATAVVMSPVYTAVTWQWVHMSQYVPPYLTLYMLNFLWLIYNEENERTFMHVCNTESVNIKNKQRRYHLTALTGSCVY
jgi:hypothetical protein